MEAISALQANVIIQMARYYRSRTQVALGAKWNLKTICHRCLSLNATRLIERHSHIASLLHLLQLKWLQFDRANQIKYRGREDPILIK